MKTVKITPRKMLPTALLSKGVAYLLLLLIMASMAQPVSAETITIGKGSGIVWEGMPFNQTLSGPILNPSLDESSPILGISRIPNVCRVSLTSIAGYPAFEIAPGVGLIPRASANASYGLYDGSTETLTTTLGLPETRGVTTPSNITVTNSSAWCLSPRMNYDPNLYNTEAIRTATIAGNWVIVADGSQTYAEVPLASMYFNSFTTQWASIFPTNAILRISSLECSVSTPTMINFGGVERLLQPEAEMAMLSYPLQTSCSQTSKNINANINLQFRALTGLYSNNPTRLSLAQGGGYITGEINNGVTGSGICNGTGGLPFNNSPVKIGNILATEATKAINNQITWRLCSGGANVPTGNVTAAAEMLVTFN
ncbi:hypothetical protein ACSILO_000683 [Yersinia enterocolitica]